MAPMGPQTTLHLSGLCWPSAPLKYYLQDYYRTAKRLLVGYVKVFRHSIPSLIGAVDAETSNPEASKPSKLVESSKRVRIH